MSICTPYLFYSLLLLFLISGNFAVAQNFSYEHYDTKNGLAGSTVYGIAQDQDGFIWFGTETGLSRFDGSKFKNYSIADGLPNNEIFNLYADKKNRLWVSCFKNEVCYYYNGKIYNRQNDPLLRKVVLKSELNSVIENASGDIILKSIELNYLIKSDGSISVIRNLASGFCDTAISFKPIGGMGTLQTRLMSLPGYVRRQTGDHSFVLQHDRRINGKDRYFCTTTVSLPVTYSDTAFFFYPKDTCRHMILLPARTNSVSQVNDNTFALVRYYNGVTLYNVDNNELTGDYLKHHTVQYVFEDMEKNLWFSTKGFGIFKLSSIRFKNYSFDDLGVRNIHEEKGKIFIGTDNDRYWSVPALGPHDFCRDGGHPLHILNGQLKDIIQRPNKAYINYASSDFLRCHKQFPHIGSIKSMQIFQDTILVATTHYSALISPRKKNVLRILYEGRTTCAFRQDSSYYVGTVNGLYRIVPGRKSQFLGDIDPLFKCHISQIIAGVDSTLWISTHERGIIGYKNGRVIVNIRQQDGLTSNICRCLFLKDDILWAGTDKGLNKIELRHNKPAIVARFTETDGLYSNIINAIYTSGPFVYVGTALGMTVFDERNVPQHAACNICITRVLVSGKDKSTSNSNLVLPHKDGNIRFEFSGISFLSGGDINFRYRLVGLNKEWQVGNEAILSYPSLPSGKYTFQIKAVNKFGDESDMRAYSFEIRKVIWEEWWFRIFLVFITITCTALVVWLLIRRSHKKGNEKLLTQQKLMALEQMALQGQLNPHFIFNSIAAIKQYYNIGALKKANSLVDTFSSLIRQTFEMGTEIFVPLDKELNYLTRYLSIEQIRFDDSFQFYIHKNLSQPESSIPIPAMLLQPLLENAVRHGIRHLTDRSGEIKIDITQKDEQVEVIISDNGIGRKQSRNLGRKSQQTASLTSTIVNMRRIDILNKLFEERITQQTEDIVNDQLEVIGTRVILSYPVSIQDSKFDKLF